MCPPSTARTGRSRTNAATRSAVARSARCIVDQQPCGHHEVAGEEQRRIPVVKRDVGLIVTRRRYHIDGPPTQLDLGDSVRPIGEVIEVPDARRVVAHDFDVGHVHELRVTRTMVEMPMGVHHQQRQPRRTGPWQQTQARYARAAPSRSPPRRHCRSASRVLEPTSRYMNGASEVAHRLSRRMYVPTPIAWTSSGAGGCVLQSAAPSFQCAASESVGVCDRPASGRHQQAHANDEPAGPRTRTILLGRVRPLSAEYPGRHRHSDHLLDHSQPLVVRH